MPLVDITTFTTFIDRLAGQYKILSEAIDEINALGPITYFDLITASDDVDLELPMLGSAHLADTGIITSRIVKQSFNPLTMLINSMLTHFNKVEYSGGYDQYLIDNDIRASDYFNQLHVAATGQYLLAKNVFCEEQVLFGTFSIISGPTISFTDGINFGNGAVPDRRATGEDFAATRLKIVVNSFGGVQCDLAISGVDENNNILVANVSIPASSVVGSEILIGSSSDRFLDIGLVSFTSVNQGSVGDQFSIFNEQERVI